MEATATLTLSHTVKESTHSEELLLHSPPGPHRELGVEEGPDGDTPAGNLKEAEQSDAHRLEEGNETLIKQLVLWPNQVEQR